MGHGQKNANRGEAIQVNRDRIVELEKLTKDLDKRLKKSEAAARLDSARLPGLEEGYRKLKLVFVSLDGRMRMQERTWWQKLLRRPALEGALFKLVPIVDDDEAKEGEEVVPRADELPEPREKGHHVLDIQSGKIGVSSEIKGPQAVGTRGEEDPN